MTMLRIISPEALPDARRDPVDAETLAAASAIVRDVRERGETAVREHAERLGDMDCGGALVLGPKELTRALEALPAADVALLERTAKRIRLFAEAQRRSLVEARMAIEGGARRGRRLRRSTALDATLRVGVSLCRRAC